MQICREMAGYSYGRADLVRRAMAKKKADVMERERQNFIYGKKNEDGSVECVGAVANGVSPAVANAIFDEMTSFAAYAFNKSHAAAYAHISYQTAFLKCHYPKEYMAALLTSVLENTDKMIGYIGEAQKLGIRILPPNINESEIGFTVVDNGIRFGLLAVKNVGKGFIQTLLREREENGPYLDLYDFCQRLGGTELNKRTLESLIRSGACDCLPHNRRQMLSAYEAVMDSVSSDSRHHVEGQLDLFNTGALEKPKFQMPNLTEFPRQELLSMEKELIGLFISGNPLDQYQDIAKQQNCAEISDILNSTEEEHSPYRDGMPVTVLGVILGKKAIQTKSGGMMAFLSLEDKTGVIEITVFPKHYSRCASALQEGEIILAQGNISLKEDEPPKLLCSNIVLKNAFDTLSAPETAAAGKQEILFLRLESKSDPRGTELLNILRRYPGQEPVRIFFRDTRKQVSLPNGIDCGKKDKLITELKKILSEQDIAVCEK